ncbi:hypothetical protein HPP92_007655 [Vanilla planifolia]|uniref:Uncharacterized protein n=1 Tax=Vanilla planifolia TaxID=51239 RepID=A0A835V637_VANPL|nr:hypothetical protein HPP92_007655 [Vanilla planifolia]
MKKAIGTSTLLMCVLLALWSMEKASAGQNCICECMKRCLPLENIGSINCAEQCVVGCRKIGFPHISKEEALLCKIRGFGWRFYPPCLRCL